jgi:hypothetical protein
MCHKLEVVMALMTRNLQCIRFLLSLFIRLHWKRLVARLTTMTAQLPLRKHVCRCRDGNAIRV